VVFQQWRKGKKISEQWCFSNGEKGKNIAGQWCFSNGKKREKLLNNGEERGSSVSQNES
jgi:hypothetical protein